MNAFFLRILPHIGIAALLALAALAIALKVQGDRLDKARRALATEQALHASDLATIRAAQTRADADWQAQIARITQANRRLNDETDRKATAAGADYVDRVLRLPPAPADPNLSSSGAVPGAEPAAGADRSGGDTLLLARADALICAANTARLQAAHDWAMAWSATPR